MFMLIKKSIILLLILALGAFLSSGCQNERDDNDNHAEDRIESENSESFEYFNLRPETEKAYGYTHAIKIGDDIKISGAVSMDDSGNPTAVGDLAQQMKNCYADLEKVLNHYGCTFDDVVVENIFTTNMAEFLNLAGFRNEIYTKNYPAGSWLEVKGLALPEFLIEIELEAHKSH